MEFKSREPGAGDDGSDVRFMIPPSPLSPVCPPLAAPRRPSTVCSRLRALVADSADGEETARGEGGKGGVAGKRPRLLSASSMPRGSLLPGDAGGAEADETARGEGGKGGVAGKRPRLLSASSMPRGSLPPGGAAGAAKCYA